MAKLKDHYSFLLLAILSFFKFIKIYLEKRVKFQWW